MGEFFTIISVHILKAKNYEFLYKNLFLWGVSQRTLAVEGVRYDILFVGAYSRESVGINDPDQLIFTTPIAKKHLAKYPGKIFSTSGI